MQDLALLRTVDADVLGRAEIANLPIKQKSGDLSTCQSVDTDCSTHQKGTNKKRARFSCFRLFAVVIRHLISRPQRCQNLRQMSQQKFEGMRKSCNGYEGSPFDDQIAVPCRNAIDGEGHFLCSHIGLKERLTNDHFSENFFSLCEFYRIREAIIGESKFFH